MRLSLATHGGQAAAINLRRPARELDTAGLPPETARQLHRLVAAASAETGGTGQASPARDAMSYTITVDDGARTSTLTGSDTAMSPAFGELLSLFERHVSH